jgi:metacaspase-1
MSRKALLIGINYCGTSSELRGCVNDCLNIRHMLINKFQVKESDIVLLTEASNDLNLIPTKANIITQMKKLVEGANSESRLFFHYSGHGSFIPDRNGDENDGHDEALCPLDYNKGLIVDDELRQVLINPLPKGCNLFAIIDACHSGTALDLRANYLFHNRKNKERYRIEIEKNMPDANANIILLSGCLDSQTSMDCFLNGNYTGALTFAFIKSYNDLKSTNKEISIYNLIQTITDNLKVRKFEQDAKISTGRLIDLSTPLTII